MKLHIENFAKIKDATLELNGLTVIAGNNNTGKSTVGKILYSIFRGLSNIDVRVKRAVRETVGNALMHPFQGLKISDGEIESIVGGRATAEEVFRRAFARGLDGVKLPQERIDSVAQDFLPSIKERISQVLDMPPDKIAKRILLGVFDCVFFHQFHPLKPDVPNAVIEFTIKDETNRLEFGSRYWKMAVPTKLFSKAHFIANPDIVNLINVKEFLANQTVLSKTLDKYTYELARSLCEEEGEDESSSSASGAVADERLSPIETMLDSVIRGRIGQDQSNDAALYEDGNSEPTKFGNLSMGLKAFVLLRMMVEREILSDQDVLILDEPEIHLHPEWQVAYAKAIVQLQQAFHLTVLVTTHSPFFVNALQRFSFTEGTQGETNFYLSERDAAHGGYCTFVSLEHRTGPIFGTFNRAYEAIEPAPYPEDF